ncbi:putative peptidase M16, alpha subunit [Cardiosporidium cionae]|uniref:Peptidase M16, alpha subunit n=1 Tax=Cardiosporidium cionae TaxID=476202 RepID=A0ABQ7J461_9APIC|nr:putative peptidase M16, alpha subunit [Cardiosporidium cionae]|eukprot:KAF8817879.1 putative peptidase M16, alpha subunit [Cardiosporidium cionae]
MGRSCSFSSLSAVSKFAAVRIPAIGRQCFSSLASARPASSLTFVRRRSFSTASPAVANSLKPLEFRTVPFVREDLQNIVDEVPEFKFYYLGDEETHTNIYASIPLDQSIPQHTSTSLSYQPVDTSLKLSKLENGLRIASVDKGGLTSSLGLFVHSGSRFEDSLNSGVSHMIENMAFHSTAHLSHLRTIKSLETLGVQAHCTIGRELTIYMAEGLRNTVPLLIPMLTGNILFPRFLPWELKSNANRLTMVREALEKNPDALVTELLHTTAWHNNTLGRKLYSTEKSLEYYNGDVLREFMLQHFFPDNMVFVGVNVDHEEICKWLMRSFVDYNAIPSHKRILEKAIYTGGNCRIEGNSPLAHLAIAFETPDGWNSADLVPMTLLHSLMGGGGSFSTGGPGKGMYTQLFLNVLNQNDWVDSCMAFNTQYTDSGLFGVYMTANPMQGEAMVRVIAEELKEMKSVTKLELNRAKNALKSSIWMNLESSPVIMEDIARQLIMSGNIRSGEDFCMAIDAVTESDIRRVAEKLVQQKPTVVAYGDISTIPHYDEICSVLKKVTLSNIGK